MWGVYVKDLDYAKLQPLSSNEDVNKKTNAIDSDVCKTEIEKYITNLREFLLAQKVYEAASILIAEQDWIKRKNSQNKFPIPLVGFMLKIDFGKTYIGECGYIHYALCIAQSESKYLVIPSTTHDDIIKVAYHPIYRTTVGKSIYLLKKNEAKNTKDCALYMNDMRFISSGRIIKKCNKIESEAYDKIVNAACEVIFPGALSDLAAQIEIKKTLEAELLVANKTIDSIKGLIMPN